MGEVWDVHTCKSRSSSAKAKSLLTTNLFSLPVQGPNVVALDQL